MPEEKQPERINNNHPEVEEIGIRKFLEYYFPGQIEEEKLKAYEYIESVDPKKLFPPYPEYAEIPTDRYSAMHTKIHREITQEIVKNDWEILVLESGMYGGKSSLAFNVLDQLKKQGYSTGIYISAVMGEDFVTARSYPDGEQIRKAKRYGTDDKGVFHKLRLPPKEYYERDQNGKLRKVHNKKRVVLLDEFSFLDEKEIKAFLQKCKDENVKVILTGLNKNYLGETLPAFEHLDTLVGKCRYKREKCKSFVPGINIDEPTGDSTVRYLNIGGKFILDLGLSKLVTSKEEEKANGEKMALYLPATKYMTVIWLLRHRPDLLEHIIHPTKEGIERQEIRFDTLKNSIY